MDNKKAVKITITYDDGSTKDLERGLVCHLTEIPDTDRVTVTADMVNLALVDFFTIITAARKLGAKWEEHDDEQT